ncbi:MAG: EAL domain-containing protein [Methylococcaceae bacterium]
MNKVPDNPTADIDCSNLEQCQAESLSKRYKMLIDHIPEGFCLVDNQGYVQEVNHAYVLMSGYSVAQLQQMHLSQLEAEQTVAELKNRLAKVKACGSDRFESCHRHQRGHILDVEVTASFLPELDHFFVFIRDITELKRAERALADSELKNRSNSERLDLASKIAAFGVWDWDIQGDVILWNDTMFDIYGLERSDTVAYQAWIDRVVVEDHARLIRSVQKVIQAQCRDEIEFKITRPDGEVRHLFSAKGVVKNELGQVIRIVGVNVDITERNQAQQTIRQLAFYDEVTHLPNRRLLLERLHQSLNAKQHSDAPFALLLLDLDRFKAVNDSFGHASGDELLQQVALRLQSHVRRIDTVARFGGDEFVVLLERDMQTTQNYALFAANIARAIIADLSRPFTLSFSHDVRIGVSIGISLYPHHGVTTDSLINNADVALYQAKHAGRGCFAYFSEQLAATMRERASLETDLHKAIERQQLRLFYQPQVDINSGVIIGAEALLRWQTPTGLISPCRFISVAEESNLIVSLGEWALREVCQQGQRWLLSGLPRLNLSINVSPYQFRRSDLCLSVARVLEETGFPAHYLSIEITESGLMENSDEIVEKFRSLRALGVRFAIDDFGTGYSSLAYLKRLPVDTLKIDKSFIDDIPLLADDMTITATIIVMGHTLGLKVLAEGVENAKQLDFLQKKGCDEYQGYYKSHPLSAEDFAQLLQQEQKNIKAI